LPPPRAADKIAGGSLWQQCSFYRSGHFVAGNLAVDAFDSSFFTARHAAPQSQNATPEIQDARNVTTQSISRNSLGYFSLFFLFVGRENCPILLAHFQLFVVGDGDGFLGNMKKDTDSWRVDWPIRC
jgi:hypothetical protein